MSGFRGLIPPLITPTTADGGIDEQGLRDHIDFMIDGGSRGVCAGSSTGEFSTMSRAEWEQVVAITDDQVGDRVPVLAGSAALSTAETIERSRWAENLGCEGLLIVSPWYQVHTQRELEVHFRKIRDKVGIPIMIYNNPPVAGVRLSVDLLVRLAKDGVIQYLKDADSDPYAITRLKMHAGDALTLFYGHDNNALGGFAFGAVGWVSGTANIDPQRWSRICDLCVNDGDFAKAREIWYEILPLIELSTVTPSGERADWIAVIKAALAARGRPVGPVREPMLPLEPEVARKVSAAVEVMQFDMQHA